jgi:hypothetical protein
VAMTNQQTKYLMEQLEEIRSSKPRNYDALKFPDTPKVKAARKQAAEAKVVIDAHEKALSAAKSARSIAISDAYHAAKREIMFGDPKRALKSIDEFRSKKF